MRDEAYTKQQLAAEFGVSIHTLSLYRSQGLLDPPEGPRCAPRYTNKHFQQIQYIRRRLERNIRLRDLTDPKPYHVIKVQR